MGNGPKTRAEWTEPEQWVWERIAAGDPADFNARPGQTELVPSAGEGWGKDRRLSAKFFQNILTQKALVEATPYGGVRILGPLIDDAPLNLEHARLQYRFWLEKSRILTDVKCSTLRVDGAFSLEQCFVAGAVDLSATDVREFTSLSEAIFEEDVSLNSAALGDHAFLCDATFKGKLELTLAKIGYMLDMGGSIFEGDVRLVGATVGNAVFLHKATFNGALSLTWAKIGSDLDMNGSIFEGDVRLNGATVGGSAFLCEGATFAGDVELNGCTVTRDFLLGYSENSAACWKDGASLTLRNAHVGALQDWWRSDSADAWPKSYQLEGFTYYLGSIGSERDANMLDRPVASYIEWLAGDPGSSPQPYEHLARRFHEAGEPYKRADVLYEARERRRRKAWSTVDNHGQANRREWLLALGLWALRATIGYGLGTRYFRVLWWVGGLTLVGTLMLIFWGSRSLAEWSPVFFASLDQLLPIVTLDKAHDTLIFGDLSAKPPVQPQPYGVLIYFYGHKILGWVLSSFLVAGLAGLTQRN